MGAMKSTPINAMQVECVEPPLHIRRQYLCDRFFFKIVQSTSHPLLDKLRTLSQSLPSNPRSMPCLLLSFRSFSQLSCPTFHSSLSPLYSLPYKALIFKPSVLLNFGINKGTIEANIVFNEILNSKWEGWLPMFCDASKLSDDACVGSAVWIPNSRIILSFKSPPCTSVFTGESIAILEAVRFAQSHKLDKSIIFSDSLSSLQAIMSNPFRSKSKFPITLKIRQTLFECALHNLKIVLAWIPGHEGIHGNETVDSCAKFATQSGSLEYYNYFSQDLCLLSLTRLTRTWNEQWRVSKSVKGKYYGDIVPDIPVKPWFSSSVNWTKLLFPLSVVFVSAMHAPRFIWQN
ncbi:uncharacterized protein LOC119193454 [Manduca sexta]|uniref:uncharacterized protein LOC119193454 n=1 Tax=Manduca sexta TaxID=7130 RepID=UPI00188F364E|nr:uncharacterized protein LOC119193454 [Manduca sexta]